MNLNIYGLTNLIFGGMNILHYIIMWQINNFLYVDILTTKRANNLIRDLFQILTSMTYIWVKVIADIAKARSNWTISTVLSQISDDV